MKLPEIKGFVDLSLVDWDGKVSAVIFLPHCNLRCPFCYNITLVLKPEEMPTITFEEIAQYLKGKENWLDGVTITGGEPTISPQLPELCRRLKEMGLGVKLDTNGTNSVMIRELIDRKLVDYIAMDVKAPFNIAKYSLAVGVDAKKLLSEIERTIEVLLQGSVDYEFRTTIVPTLHSKEDIEQICNGIKGCKKYILQSFKGDVETLNPQFSNIKPFSPPEMQEFVKLAKKVVPNTRLR